MSFQWYGQKAVRLQKVRTCQVARRGGTRRVGCLSERVCEGFFLNISSKRLTIVCRRGLLCPDFVLSSYQALSLGA